MADIITTLPILMFFLTAWLVFFILGLYQDVSAWQLDENKNKVNKGERTKQVERKLLLNGFSLAMIIFIIAFSIIQVNCVDCLQGTTTLGSSEFLPVMKISEAFVGLFIVQAIYFLFVCVKVGVLDNPAIK